MLFHPQPLPLFLYLHMQIYLLMWTKPAVEGTWFCESGEKNHLVVRKMCNMASSKELVLALCLMQVFVDAAPRQPRLSLAENSYIPYYYINDVSGGKYSFGYDVSDPATGNTQYRSEERHANGTVTGNYGYIDPAGTPRMYRYIADQAGYRVYPEYRTLPPMPLLLASTEPSITWTRPKRPKNKNKTWNNVAPKVFI